MSNGYPVSGCILARVPQKLYHSDDDGQREATEEHDEDAAHVAHVQRACRRVLVLVVMVTRATVLPPAVVEHLDLSLLLQLQDCHGKAVAIRRV